MQLKTQNYIWAVVTAFAGFVVLESLVPRSAIVHIVILIAALMLGAVVLAIGGLVLEMTLFTLCTIVGRFLRAWVGHIEEDGWFYTTFFEDIERQMRRK